MAEQRDDPTGINENSGGSGGAANKAQGAAQNAKKLTKILKSLKTMGLLGTIFVWVIVAIVVILIIIGLLGFFLEMPSLMGDKLAEIKNNVFGTIGSFLDGNKAYITEDDQLELAEYLENMGYPPYEFGFGKLEEKEENGEISQSIDSKYLNAYLLADYNTYTVYSKVKAGISSFLHGAGEFFFGNPVTTPEEEGTKEAHFGMLHFEKYNGTSWDIGDIWTDNIDIDVQNMTLTLSASDWDGVFNRASEYTFNMDGWAARYGKPLDLSITLHLATMAPDLVYKLIMDEEENTAIYIGRTENQVRIRMKYRKNEGVTTNFGAISDELENLDEVEEFETDEILQIENFLAEHVEGESIETLRKVEAVLKTFLNSSYSTYSDSKYWGGTASNYLLMELTDITNEQGMGMTPSPAPISIANMGTALDSAINASRDKLSEGQSFKNNNDADDPTYLELFGGNPGIQEYNGQLQPLIASDTGFSMEYTNKVLELCEENDIATITDLAENEEVKEELYNFAKEKLQVLYDEAKPDIDLIYEVSGDPLADQLREEMEKIGLTDEALDRSDYYNDSLTSNEDGEQLSKVEPYIVSVEKHWYRNVYFTLGSIESETDKDYIEEHYPDWDGAYETAESDATVEYDFQPGEDSDDFALGPTEYGKWVVVEKTISGESKSQVRDAVRGEVNAHTKELFVGTEDKPAKYFVYDGSEETAKTIDELREIYNDTYQSELEYYVYSEPTEEQKAEALATAEAAVEAEEARRGTNCFKEVDVRSNALAAFSILENNTSEDAEYILRDLKNLFVDLGYFTKEELKTADTHVFQWPLSGYFNAYWPQKRFEKQQRDYGTIIRSKVSTDNIRNGNNADGSERTDAQEQSWIYEPNLNPDATVTEPSTDVPELDEEEPEEGEPGEEGEEDEISNPTDTLVDGFEPGLNVLSPVTGEIIEEGADYIKIKVLDNTAITEYEPFYNKYKDVCTGYIMYIKGFQKSDINSSSVTEYKKVTHTDAYFTKYGYDQAGMEKWREDEDKRVEAPAYIERDGKRYIKEGTVIGTTTNSDIVLYFINRENSMIEDVESYIRLAKKGIDTEFPEEFIFWLGVCLEGTCEGEYDLGSSYGVEVLEDGAGNTTAFGLTKSIAHKGDVPEMYPDFAEHLASGQVPKEEAQGVFLLVLEAARESVLDQIDNDDLLSENLLDALVDLQHASESECSKMCDLFNQKGTLTIEDFEEHWGSNTKYEEQLRGRGHVRGVLAVSEEYRNPYSGDSYPLYTFTTETPWTEFVNGTPSSELYTLD